RQQFAFPIGRDDGPVGLAGYPAGLQDELAPTPIKLNTMDIEHCVCLSRFRRGESHEQDGERLPRAHSARTDSASSDPAMALGRSLARTGALRPSLKPAAASLPDGGAHAVTAPAFNGARNCPRTNTSAADAQPLDQRLVALLVGTIEVIEQLTTLGHKLEQAAPGMVVLDVALEMLGQAVDALSNDCHLHFRRTGIAGLGRIGLDDFRLAFGRDRHRVSFSSLSF